jgi:opacity protein-like surface antigen
MIAEQPESSPMRHITQVSSRFAAVLAVLCGAAAANMRRVAQRRGRAAILLGILGSALMLSGQGRADPFYAGISLGGNASGDVAMRSRSNDRASICDEYINPRALSVPGCVTPERGAGDGWAAPFDGGRGFSAEAELGYRFSPRFRVALAYGYNATKFDQTVSSTDASGVDFDKIGNELASGEESLGSARSHELFAVAYRDWPNRSRWTPFVGAGAGLARVRKDFSWVWVRSTDPGDILTGRDQPNANEILRNLAGTVSAGRSALRDTMAAFLLLAGASRQLTDTVSVAFKVQWKRFGTFDSGAYSGGLLRSHAPNLRLDGSEPVSTWTRTDDTDRYSVMLTMRFGVP